MIHVGDLALLFVAFIATFIAVVHDLKTREVPDWISYGLIFSALTIRAMYALLFKEPYYLLYAFLGLFTMYIFGMLMFRTKQWGGGDAKLIMGLGVVFSTSPFFVTSSYLPFLVIFLINTLVVGALYGLLFGCWLAWKKRKQFKKTVFVLMNEKKVRTMRVFALILVLPLFLLAFTASLRVMRLSLMIVALLVLIYPYLWLFIKSIEKACLFRTIPPSKLTEGDWVEQDIIVNKKMIYKKKNIGIEKSDIQKLIKAKIKKVLVKDGIPFTPSFLFGMIISLFHGGIVLLL